MSVGKKLIIAFLCLLCILFSSCDLFGVNNNTNQPQKLVKAALKDQVYIAPQIGISDFSTLDPALASDASSMNAVQMVFTGLVGLDDSLQVHPQLAQSWDESSDGLIWTFYLKPHLEFSDGKALTSRDVAYSIDRALQPATKSTVAPIYLDLVKDSDKLLTSRISTLIGDSLLTPNDSTLIIKVKRQAAYFLSMLAYPCSDVVEKSLISKYGAKFTDHLNEGGGSGPWQVQQYLHGKEIDFVPNQTYYGTKPQLIKVIFPFYPQPGVAYQAYQAGRVDTVSAPVATFAIDKKRTDFHQMPQLWINYYTMNYLVKPFDDIKIRQAFALAIDKVTIVNNVWKGTLLPTNHIVPQGMVGYNPKLTGPDGLQSLSGNPTEARALLQQGLQEEKWSSVTQMPPIKLTYAASMSNLANEAAAMIKVWQSVLGVTVTADPVNFDTLLAKIIAATGNPNGLQFWGFAWIAEYPDPQDWLTLQFDSGAPNNNMNYGQNSSSDAAKQQATQQELEAADANPRQDARLQAYQAAEQQLVNDVAWMPMEQVTQTFLRRPYVIGVVDNALGLTPPDDWANIYIAQH
jgi:oligopeptide transport system substrate-binding protein